MTDRQPDPTHYPATELVARLTEGELAPTTVVEAFLERITDRNEDLNAYLTVTEELARARAREAEQALDAADELGPLHGVPVALKDLGDLKAGVRHTFGSRLIDERGFTASRTSVAVERLEDAGAVVLGKTNVPEFGHKGTTDNDIIGPTASPIDPSLNAGGSSGGSAAAVGAGLAAVALGSDAGGSIRIPAACCGVVGYKPSFGLVPIDSRPNAFDTKTHHFVKGPITRTVADAALTMDVIAGPHPRDPASVPVEIDYRGAVDRDIANLRVAYSPALDVFPVESAVDSTTAAAAKALESAGATVTEIEIDHGLALTELCDAVATTFSTAMVDVVTSVRESFDIDLRDHPDRVSASLLEMIEMGDSRTIEDVAATGVVRTQVFDAIQAVFAEYDLVATPTLAVAGFDDEIGPTEWEQALTWPFNWTGHPAISIPAGLTDDGRPVGLQLVGQRYEDDTVLAGAAALECERPWDG